MKRISDLTQILAFLLFLALGLILLIVLPRRTFSEQENRVLAQPPRFRLSDLASGAFTQILQTEDHPADHHQDQGV